MIFAGVSIIIISSSQFLDIFLPPSNKFENERGWDHLQGVSISRLHCIQTSICLFWHCSCSKEYIHIRMIVQDTVIQIQSKYTYRGLYKTLTDTETSILDRCLEVAQVFFGLVFSTLHLLLFWYCFFFLTCRVVLYTWSGNWKTASIFCYPNLWSIVLFCKTYYYCMYKGSFSGLPQK